MRYILVAGLVALALVTACGEEEGPSREPGGSPSADSATPASFVDWHDIFESDGQAAAATVTPVGATRFPAVRLEPAFDGQTFLQMTGLYPDGDGNWYVTEQPGSIQRIDGDTGQASLWLDLTDRVDGGGDEKGLLGFALAPDFGTSGVFYLSYTTEFESLLARFRAVDGVPDPDSGEELLSVIQPHPIHNGGPLVFGPDGYLYMGFGDGGENDRLNVSQNLENFLGSILRLDVSGETGYAIPEDNPFIDDPDALDEIWAYGFRNPWRMSFDRETGDFWAADVGDYTREEIDLIERGGNYGWRIMEGTQCRQDTNCDPTGFVPPVFDYPPDGTHCAVIGGYVYRGRAIPELQGAYVFSDLCSGVVSALRVEDGEVLGPVDIGSSGALVSSLAEGPDGELYVLEIAAEGEIFRIVP